GLTPATLGDSDSLVVGDEVVAVGAPFGLESTVTSGIVSALNRPVTTKGERSGTATVFPAIQTDAAINPGNSGGPLIDLEGNVVGINTAIRTSTGSSGTQGGSIGLGFAIPISDAVAIVEQLRAGEQATHARIGVSVGVSADDVGLPGGALVQSVEEGTAADEAGLKEGDVITEVDGVPITDANSLVATVRSYRPGDTVALTITASRPNGEAMGEPREVEIELGSD
nr:trypsin-like peptidase domain-containing protein [Nocardioidaceae bacterium]